MEAKRDEVLGIIRGVIHRLPIPTPWAVGRVNCYLVEDDPLTLVDTGPNSGGALDALERALARHGRRVEDLERIVITHHHPDHEGLLDILKRRVGRRGLRARPARAVAERLAAAEQKADDAHAAALMRSQRRRREDVVVRARGAVVQSFRAWGSDLRPTRVLADGGTLAFADRSLDRPPPARALLHGHRLPRRRAARADRRRPPDRPHLLQPARSPRTSRGRWSPTWRRCARRRRWTRRHGPPRPRRPRHRRRRAGRPRACGCTSAAPARSRGDARRRAADRTRRSRGRCGATSPSSRRSSRSARCSATSTCSWRTAASCRARTVTPSRFRPTLG